MKVVSGQQGRGEHTERDRQAAELPAIDAARSCRPLTIITNRGAGSSAGSIQRKSRGMSAAMSVSGYPTQFWTQNGPELGGVRIAIRNEMAVVKAVRSATQSLWQPTSATRPRDSPALDRNVGGAPRGPAVASGARPGRRLGRGALLARPQPAAHDVAELKDAFVDQRVVDEQPVFPAVHELESVEQLKVLGEIGLVQT